MTIQNTTICKAGPSQGNGVTTVFPFTFKVFTTADILVTYLDASGVESVLVLTTNYTVSLNADQNTSPGGSVTLLVAPATGTYITLTSQLANTQTLALTNSGGFYPESINNALDRTVIQIQQLAEQASRAIKFPVSDITSNPNLPNKTDRLGSLLAFDAITGNPTKGPRITYVDTVTSNIPTIDAVGANISSVTAVASDLTNINTAVSNLTNINTIATAVSNVNAVGNNISSVNSAATNMAAIIAAPSNAAVASSSATAAATAKDAAQLSAGVYANTTAGLAATTTGKYFSVPSANTNEYLILYLNSSGTAVQQQIYPSATAVIDTVGIQTINSTTPVASGSWSGATYSMFNAVPSSITGFITTINVAVASLGSFNVLVVTLDVGGTLTLVSSTSVSLRAGFNSLTNLSIPIVSGQYIGLFGSSGIYTAGSGLDAWYTTGIPTTGTSKVVLANLGLQLQAVVMGSVIHTDRALFPTVQSQNTILSNDFISKQIGLSPTAVGSVFSLYSLFNASPVITSGYLTSLLIAVSSVQTATVLVANLNGDGTLTVTNKLLVTLTTGINNLTNLSLPVVSGQYVGIYATNVYYTPSAASLNIWYTAGLTGTSTAKTVLTGQGLQFQITISALSRLSVDTVPSLSTALGSCSVFGKTTITATGITTSSNLTLYNAQQTTTDGYIESLQVAVLSPQYATIVVASINSANTQFTLISSATVYLSAGFNTITNVNLAVSAGQFVGVYASGIYTTGSGLAAWYTTGLTGVGTSIIKLTNFGLQLNYTISSGVQKKINALTNATGLLVALNADSSGVADSTASFAKARATTKSIYVPEGTYSVTALPNYGDGLYGNGKVNVNNTQFVIPYKPLPTSLYLKLRNYFAPQLYDKSPVVLIGDSISVGYGPSTAANSWFYKFNAFVNLYTSPNDLPSMVNFDSALPPSFFGVTIPASPTLGSNGPTRHSLILSSGQSISFTGIYEDVSVFYTQATSAGSLVFDYNSTVFRTINCAGSTAYDVTTYPNPTSQTTSQTYTITATGGSVEITGVMRLGVTNTNQPPRLFTMNHSHGSYSITTFTTNALNSIIKQSQFAGGNNALAIIALGENDQLTTLPSVIYTNLINMITTLKTGGFKTIIGCGVLKPASGVYTYSAGCSYDGANGAIRSAFRDQNCRIISIDAIDFDGLGFGTPHPNDEGQVKYLQMMAETISEFS